MRNLTSTILIVLLLFGVTAFYSAPDLMADDQPVFDIEKSTKEAEQGDAKAQNDLGFIYQNGLFGVSQDLKAAIKWYGMAAKQGNVEARKNLADAQYSLGFSYELGNGVPQDLKTAIKLYSMAAEQGNLAAQKALGVKNYTGKDTLQDYKEAMRWFTLAAKQGDVIAQSLLGSMYAQGQGATKDDRQAAKWYTKAAEQGSVADQSIVGVMYFQGNGVPQDYSEAYAWLNLAAASGHKQAIEWREKVLAKMSPQQTADAQKLSKELYNRISAKIEADKEKNTPKSFWQALAIMDLTNKEP